MPPWLSVSAIKDVVIVGMVIALGWWVYHQGENTIRVKDFAALQQQIKHQAAVQQKWQTAQANSQSVLSDEIQQIVTPHSGVVRPLHIRLCQPSSEAGTKLLSGASPAPKGKHSAARATVMRPGPDIGPAVQAFERKYETALAQCRAVIREWPRR